MKYYRSANKLRSVITKLGGYHLTVLEDVERVKKELKERLAGKMPDMPVVISIDGSHGTGKTAFGDVLRETLGEVVGRDKVVMLSRGDYTDMMFESFKKRLAEEHGLDASSPDYEKELLRRLGSEGEDINKVIGKMLTEEDSVKIDEKALDLMIRNIMHAVREGKHIIVEGDGSATLVRQMKDLNMLPARTVNIFLTTPPEHIEHVLRARGEKPDLRRIIERLEEDASRYERLSVKGELNEFLRYIYKKEAEKNRRISEDLRSGRAPRVEGYDLYLEVKHSPRIMDNVADLLRKAVSHIVGEKVEQHRDRGKTS